jgi:hypothetical protein
MKLGVSHPHADTGSCEFLHRTDDNIHHTPQIPPSPEMVNDNKRAIDQDVIDLTADEPSTEAKNVEYDQFYGQQSFIPCSVRSIWKKQ